MTLTFHNPTALDPRAWSTFGLSAKETTSPIGYFGTGLKYAIAGILRTGGDLAIRAQGNDYGFRLNPTEFRGKAFSAVQVSCNLGPWETLPFTSDLGPHWLPWMFFRELWSNALDEGGDVTLDPIEAETSIRVLHPDFAKLYAERETIILHTPPDHTAGNVSVWLRPADQCYVHGIRAYERPCLLTWSVDDSSYLTEDRTLRSLYLYSHEIAVALECLPSEIRQTIFTAPPGTFESDIPYSPRLDSIAAKHLIEMGEADISQLSEWAKTEYARLTRVSGAWKTRPASDYETRRIEQTLKWLKGRGLIHEPYFPVHIALNAGSGAVAWACHKTSAIYLNPSAPQASESDFRWTLYEEWVHLAHDLDDETRALQNFLFRKVIFLAEQLESNA